MTPAEMSAANKMAKTKGPKFYAVAVGRVVGVYTTWGECKSQTSGYSGAVFKGFATRQEAQAFCAQAKSASPDVAAAASGTAACTNEGRKRSRVNDVSVTLSRQKKVAKSNDQSSEPNFVLQITIHFDGGSRGNPGVAGAGSEVVIVNRSTDVISTSTYSVREYCGESATNNFAEYKGLLAGLETTKSFIEKLVSGISLPKTATWPLFRLKVYGDSNLIIQQMRGTWQCKHPNIMPFFHACRSLIEAMKKYDARSVVEFEHVYREQNKVADALANEAMDRRESWITSTTDVPISGGVEKKPTGRKNIASAPSTKEAIDVDDSDENSHHSC